MSKMTEGKKRTILIVDDDPMFLCMLQQFFEKEGYAIQQAADGEMAISVFKAYQPDCILMDVSMPVLDGFDTCRAIRAMPEGRDVPIIMVTIQGSDSVVDSCYDAGASDYINKPIHWAVLRNRIRNLIARTTAENKIKKTKEKLKKAQAVAHMGSWELNHQKDKSLYWSDEVFHIFEITPNDAVINYEYFLSVIHPEDSSRVNAAYSHALHVHKGFSIEHRLLMTDGRIKWVHEQCETVFSDDGTPLQLVGVVQDITARKKAENSLQLISELSAKAAGVNFFETLVGATANALGVKIVFVAELVPNTPISSARTLALWVGKHQTRSIEYPLAGTPCEQILTGKILAFPRDLKKTFPTDTWLTEVGAESYVGIPICDDAGQVIGHMGIMDDKPILDQQQIINIMLIFVDRAAAELKQQQSNALLQKLSQALEQAGESILITNKKGVIEYINPAFTRISGYTTKDAIGKTPAILNSANQSQSFYTTMWETIASGEVWHGKVVDKKKDGSFYPAMLTIAPIVNVDGEISHFVGSHADLTELENMEKQFQASQKMEAIGTLVGGVAHDFNNMLAAITGNLYLAKLEIANNSSVFKKLTVIEDVSFRAADMIKQLLTFARKDRVKMEQFEFTPFIKETMGFLHASIPENISIKQHICPNLLEINGDQTLLHQVLMNLINNARDAVEGVNDPCITVSLRMFMVDKTFLKKHGTYVKNIPYAQLTIVDNGCGIPNNQQEHLFEPFFSTKEQGKGTGLGLAMVFGAIKRHNGFIEVDSSDGKGAAFHVYIPLVKQKTNSLPVLEKKTSKGKQELILIADDEIMVRETMVQVLNSMNYRVLQASDGLEAIKVFKAHEKEINLALLDVVMPHCGGISLAVKIRRISPNMPVVFLTGYDRGHIQAGDQRVENSDILSKPVNFTVLNNTIRRLLG